MKILYLTFDDLSAPYAWSVHVRAVVNGLVARGHELRLVAPGGAAPGMNAPCDALRPGKWCHLAGSLGIFVRSGEAFAPDVVYARGIHVSVTPVLAAARLGVPFVAEVNGILENEVPKGLRRTAVRMTHRYTLARTARVVTVSPLFRDELSRRYGFPSDRIDVVPNGADIELFKPGDRETARRRLGLPVDRPVILCVASFFPHHARETIIEAAAGSGAVLVLVGGPTLAAGSVICTGPVPHERVPEYVAASDLCAIALKSRGRGYGSSALKVYEYMAGGRPVVAATETEDLSRFVRESGIGVAVPLEAGPLTSAFRSLIDDGPGRERMGKRGRALAEKTFNWGRAVEQVESCLFRACGKGQS